MERACFSPARNRSTAWRLTLPIAVCTHVLCNFSVARAEDTTSTPYPGVTHIRRVTSSQRIHAVKVDLTLKTIRLRATRPPGGKTVPTFASDYGVQVAINGDFGTRTSPWKTSGLAMGDGDVWSNTSDNAHEGFIAFGVDNRVELSSPADILAAPEDWMREIVGGRPQVVNEGIALDAVPPWSFDGCAPHFCQNEPRSAIGISQDGKTLILATIDGRYSGATGMTTKQVGVLMAELGAWTALNIDGGGSTTLVVASQGGVVNTPSDGCCRVVSNHLGIQIVEPFGDLTGFVRHAAIDNESEPIAGANVSLSTGETTTADAEGRYSFTHVAAGDVTVTAAAAGYADASVDRYVAAADTTWGSIAMFEPDERPDAGGVADPGVDGGAEPGGTMDGGCSAAGNGGGWTAAALVLFIVLLAARRRWPVWLFFLAACHGSIDPGDTEGGRDGDPAPDTECAAPPDLPLVGDDHLPLDAIAAAPRPHWGSATHGDGGCSDWSSSKYADWSIYRWAGCHETVYYQIEGSVPSQWHAAIDAAFAAWDVGTLCSPHWQNVTTHPGADAKVHVERNGFHCGGGGGVWYACVLRDKASSERDQHWWMNLNDAEHAMGVGVTDALDVQSLVTVELAHIHYLAHMPRFDDSVSTLNNCRWGASTCRVTAADSCDWSSGDVYDAHCDNCGDRRELLPGDLATLEHIYGEAAGGCATPGEVALACEGCCGADSCGYQTRTCSPDHRWSEATCVE